MYLFALLLKLGLIFGLTKYLSWPGPRYEVSQALRHLELGTRSLPKFRTSWVS